MHEFQALNVGLDHVHRVIAIDLTSRAASNASSANHHALLTCLGGEELAFESFLK